MGALKPTASVSWTAKTVIQRCANAQTAWTQAPTNRPFEKGVSSKRSEGAPKFVVTAPAMDARRSIAPASGAAKAARQAAIVQTASIIRNVDNI